MMKPLAVRSVLYGATRSALAGATLAVATPAVAPLLAAQSTGPSLILEDSVLLQETTHVFVGQPVTMFLGDDGSFFVIDGFSNSVLRFSSSGHHVRTYGRRGGGPGEFAYIGEGGFASGVLGVADGHPPRQEIEFFDLQSGEHLGTVETSSFVSAMTVHGRSLWAGGIDMENWQALATKPLRALPGGRSWARTRRASIVLDRVQVPRPYVVNEMIRGMSGSVSLHVEDDDVLVGFMASPFLLHTTRDGEVLDTIPLLARERRGVPDEDELIEMMRPGQQSYEELFRIGSALVDLSRSNGYILTVHQDSELHGQQVSGWLYASSLREDGTEQCPDTPVPASDVGRPVTAFQGASLFVLDQRIHDDSPQRLRTVVRRFTVDPRDCSGQVLAQAAER